jgi:GNAT superfamily N-acetyltransferase
MRLECFEGDATIEADDVESLADRFVEHARSAHEWPYPDQAIRNYAEATQRLTGGADRLDEIGEVEVHPVTADRVEDWLAFFDHDAFVGTPEWAACYCLEPHAHVPGERSGEHPSWRDNRAAMIGRFRDGGTYGYLAYVDGRPAGWVNASTRADYTLFRGVDPEGPDPGSVVGVSCFIIAPPYRRHGLAARLLDRVIADAGARGAAWIEGYPRREPEGTDPAHFRGPRSLYDARGFMAVEERERDTVMRLAAPAV